MKPIRRTREARVLSGHGGTARREHAENRGRRRPEAEGRGKAREAANALRLAKRASRQNPFAPEAVARRAAAKDVLAEALNEAARVFREQADVVALDVAAELERAHELRTGEARRRLLAPAPRVDGLWGFHFAAKPSSVVQEKAQRADVLAAELEHRAGVATTRAAAVARCGVARVAFDEAAGEWVCGEHGLAVAVVDECGHRLCPLCAARASRRNRKRIVDRVAVLDDMARAAAEGSLAARYHAAIEEADNAADVVARGFAGVVGGFAAAAAKQLAIWRKGGRPLLSLLDTSASTLAVVRRGHDGVDETMTSTSAEVAAITRGLVDEAAFTGEDVDLSTLDTVDAGEADIMAAVMRKSATKAQAKAVASLAKAIGREEAAALLVAAEKPQRRQRVARAERAAVDAVAFALAFDAGTTAPSSCRIALDGEKWVYEVHDVAVAAVYGPPAWRTRERERAAAQMHRAAEGDARALRSIERQDAEGWARLRWQTARGLWHDAVKAARAGRRAVVALDVERREARKAAARAHLWRSHDVRFLTLTQWDDPAESCAAALARLDESLVRLQRLPAWRDQVAGAVVHIEVERSTPETRKAKALRQMTDARTLRELGHPEAADELTASARNLLGRETRIDQSAAEWWHAHAHVAAACGFWSVDDVNAAWRKASRSCRVRADIRMPTRGVAGVLDELTKYITKPVGLARMTVQQVCELSNAISGRRLLRCTGALRGVVIEEGHDGKQEKEGHEGDGTTAPLGHTVVAVVDGVVIKRDVYESDVIWREDAEAQEVRRQKAFAAWEHHRAGRVRGDVDALPVL